MSTGATKQLEHIQNDNICGTIPARGSEQPIKTSPRRDKPRQDDWTYGVGDYMLQNV